MPLTVRVTRIDPDKGKRILLIELYDKPKWLTENPCNEILIPNLLMRARLF